jgi:hypothetical protein
VRQFAQRSAARAPERLGAIRAELAGTGRGGSVTKSTFHRLASSREMMFDPLLVVYNEREWSLEGRQCEPQGV